MMSTPSSLLSRIKIRWANWQHQHVRYEYPEAHRTSTGTPKSSRGNNNNSSSNNSSEARVLDPEELLPLQLHDHPLHQTTYSSLNNHVKNVSKFVFWTTVHAGAMYLFWVHIKPRLVHYWREIEYGSEDNDDDDTDTTTRSKSWRKRFSFCKKRLCCCCEEMVSERDNFCPHCGAATCPVCVYCGAAIQNDDNFCKACGQPVPNQVILDGAQQLTSSSRRSSTASTATAASTSNRGASISYTPNPNMSPLQNRTVMQPPPAQPQPQQQPQEYLMQHQRSSLSSTAAGATTSSFAAASPPPPFVGTNTTTAKQDSWIPPMAQAESVPIVQAETAAVPLVPAMYVEEVTAVVATTTNNGGFMDHLQQQQSPQQSPPQVVLESAQAQPVLVEQQIDAHSHSHTEHQVDDQQQQQQQQQQVQEEMVVDIVQNDDTKGEPSVVMQGVARAQQQQQVEEDNTTINTTEQEEAVYQMYEARGLVPYGRLVTRFGHLEDLKTELLSRGCTEQSIDNWTFAERKDKLRQLELQRLAAADDAQRKFAAKAFCPQSTARFRKNNEGRSK